METAVVYFGLVLTRCAAFVAALPLFGGSSVPRTVKVGLAMALAVLYFSALFGAAPVGELLARPYRGSWLVLGLAVGREALLGALLGFAFGLFLAPIQVAGEYLTQELGLAFGAFLDPSSGAPTGSFTRMLEILAVFVFFALDGHHLCFAVLHATWTRYPVGGVGLHLPAQTLVDGVAAAEEYGLLLAAPVALCLFLMTVVLALMTRAAPQLNLFTVGFPLRLVVGFAGLFLLAPNLIGGIVTVLGKVGEFLLRVV